MVATGSHSNKLPVTVMRRTHQLMMLLLVVLYVMMLGLILVAVMWTDTRCQIATATIVINRRGRATNIVQIVMMQQTVLAGIRLR